jgi:hypothetical protein
MLWEQMSDFFLTQTHQQLFYPEILQCHFPISIFGVGSAKKIRLIDIM